MNTHKKLMRFCFYGIGFILVLALWVTPEIAHYYLHDDCWSESAEDKSWIDIPFFLCGYVKGTFEARLEIRRDRVTWFDCKTPALAFNCETGLMTTNGFTYNHRPYWVGRVMGHNKLIKKYLAKHPSSDYAYFKDTESICSLKDYFREQSEKTAPIPLIVGGESSISPDGEYEIYSVNRPPTKYAYIVEDPILIVRNGDIAYKLHTPSGFESASILWVPEYPDVVIVRTRARHGDRFGYWLIDLKLGAVLIVDEEILVRDPQDKGHKNTNATPVTIRFMKPLLK